MGGLVPNGPVRLAIICVWPWIFSSIGYHHHHHHHWATPGIKGLVVAFCLVCIHTSMVWCGCVPVCVCVCVVMRRCDTDKASGRLEKRKRKRVPLLFSTAPGQCCMSVP